MLEHLLGNLQLSYFFAALFFAFVGVAISLLIHTTSRTKESELSPYHFNVLYLLADNWRRIVLNIILILISIRFYPDYNNGDLISMKAALLLGVGYDRLAEGLKNLGAIDKDNKIAQAITNKSNSIN